MGLFDEHSVICEYLMKEKGMSCTCPVERTREVDIILELGFMKTTGHKDFKEAQENPERYFKDMVF